MAVFAKDDPEKLIVGFGEKEAKLNRHPKLEASYFQELSQTWPAWKDFIDENMIYDSYFPGDDEDMGVAYWQALAGAARGQPVFQECRTASRIRSIKNQLSGTHIYLWRNPWDQWWSYKVTPYFDIANQLIVHARNAPMSVRCMLAELKLRSYERRDLVGSFDFYKDKFLTSEQSYLIFYLLWCLALRHGIDNADFLLNIDRLSDSEDYQKTALGRLGELGVHSIDFSDCDIPQGRYLERDKRFFLPLESRVHQWLAKDGWTQEHIENIQTLRQQYQPSSWSAPIAQLSPAEAVEQASRARDLAVRFESNLAEHARATASHRSALESYVHTAEAVALTFEVDGQQEETRWQQAERWAVDIQAQLQQALEVSREAGQLVQQAEARAQQAEAASRGALMQLRAVQASASWRVTAPLRFGAELLARPGLTVRKLMNHAISRMIEACKSPLSRLMEAVLKRPQIARIMSQFLVRYPELYQQLLCVARSGGVVADASRNAVPAELAKVLTKPEPVGLTPRARQIFTDMQAVIGRDEGNS